jgi:hypothetical protein
MPLTLCEYLLKTKNRTRWIIAVITVLFFSERCFAFADGDVQVWQTTCAYFDLDEDWAVTVQEHLKLGHDAGHLYLHQTDLGFVYQGLADWIDLGFNFKHGFRKNDDGHWSRENRPHLNITFYGRLGSLDFDDRSRFEYRDKEHQEDLWRYVHRLKVKLPFEFTKYKFRPFVADQVYLNLEGQTFEKNRIYSGVSFELTKNVESEFYYVWESRQFDDQWKDLNAFGFTLEILF